MRSLAGLALVQRTACLVLTYDYVTTVNADLLFCTSHGLKCRRPSRFTEGFFVRKIITFYLPYWLNLKQIKRLKVHSVSHFSLLGCELRTRLKRKKRGREENNKKKTLSTVMKYLHDLAF